MPVSKEDLRKLNSRVNEQYLITQFEHATSTDSFTDRNNRLEDFKRVYRGEWQRVMADGSVQRVKPLVENIAKRALHDIAGLARSARSSVVFIPENDGDKAAEQAKVRESIADTHWEVGRGRKQEKQLYMDLVGPAGMAALAVSFDKDVSDYPTYTRLDPGNCYPDVRGGVLRNMVYIETVKLRIAQDLYPNMIPGDVAKWSRDECNLIEFYDKTEVVRGLVFTASANNGGGPKSLVVDRWEHKLGRVPVAFVQAETFDGAFRGTLDQVEGGLTARNDIVKYLMDYIDSMVHAPFTERGILNPEDLPGPFTIYHEDTTIPDSHMMRVPPAAPAGAVFGLIGILAEQTQGEAVQPPARQGQVPQSIASGSFVNSTQGQLTTVIEELQDMMVDLRQQATYIGLSVDERWLNETKPMIRPVGKKRTYNPGNDIDGYHFCKVQFGAMQGITKLDADVRVLNHKGAGLISDQTAREQIDYLDDYTSEQDQIDQETMRASFLQRIATDPNMPPYIIANIILAQAEGKSFIEAIREVQPDLVNMPTQQAPAGPEALPQPEPGEVGAETSPVQGQIPGGGSAEPDLSKLIPNRPIQQLVVRNPNG